MHKRSVGNLGEQVACSYLERNGYVIIERNFRRKWGEIDIIAVKGGIVRFVEVKAAVSSDISREKFSRENGLSPEELVHGGKLKKLARTAALYMEEREDDREYQIDALAVILNETSRTARFRLYEQAL